MWSCVNIREREQQAFYRWVFTEAQLPPFPARETADSRYHGDSPCFPLADAQVLAAVLDQNRPKRCISVGSGPAVAALLDSLDHLQHCCAVTVIEPFAERLMLGLRKADASRLRSVVAPVQQVPLVAFDALVSGDVLLINSSHIAEAGSDVTWLFLRVLPLLRPGVWVQIHNISFEDHCGPFDGGPGCCWNESVFLRALLFGSNAFRVRAFNSFAHSRQGQPGWPSMAESGAEGTSLWLQRTS